MVADNTARVHVTVDTEQLRQIVREEAGLRTTDAHSDVAVLEGRLAALRADLRAAEQQRDRWLDAYRTSARHRGDLRVERDRLSGEVETQQARIAELERRLLVAEPRVIACDPARSGVRVPADAAERIGGVLDDHPGVETLGPDVVGELLHRLLREVHSWGAPDPAEVPYEKAGDRVVDGDVPGVLVKCPECHGDGLLHRPDSLTAPALEPPTETPVSLEVGPEPATSVVRGAGLRRAQGEHR